MIIKNHQSSTQGPWNLSVSIGLAQTQLAFEGAEAKPLVQQNIALQNTLRWHFSPVATEEVFTNRRVTSKLSALRSQNEVPFGSVRKTICSPEIEHSPHELLQAELRLLMLDCSRAGWDGYGAEAISPGGEQAAKRFIQSLPAGTPTPELAADPDGCVTFEWRKSPRRTLLVSVRPGAGLDYAALIDAAKAYGSEPFIDELPAMVLTLIQLATQA